MCASVKLKELALSLLSCDNNYFLFFLFLVCGGGGEEGWFEWREGKELKKMYQWAFGRVS